ncbi:helix-turn-helix domain-containing protein [Oerskovia paurometabola]|uniref:helix-turn-helix domain-containing protein n=1 Tax=Oerskovia paurometabola TaxID=162170 RepID=UPI003807FA4D
MNKFEYQKALRGAGLTAQQYMVLMTLQTYANADGTRAHPGWDKLRADTSLDPRTIKSAVKALEARGFLVCTESQRVRGSANVYSLTLPLPSTASSMPEEALGDPWNMPDKSHGSSQADPRGTSVALRGTSVAPQGGQQMPPHQVRTPDPEHHERHAPDERRGANDDNWQHDQQPLSSTWRPYPHQIERATTLGLDIDEVQAEFIAFHYCTCSRAPKSTSWGAKFTAFIDMFEDERYQIDFHDHRARHVDQLCPDCNVDLMWSGDGRYCDYICPECNQGYNRPPAEVTNQGV